MAKNIDYIRPEELLGADSDVAFPSESEEEVTEDETVVPNEEIKPARRLTPREAQDLSDWVNSGWQSMILEKES